MDFTLRLATQSDLDAVVGVLIGAAADDPIYPYRYPYRHLYPDDFEQHCRLRCLEYLNNSTVVVCEMPGEGNPERKKVIAFSVWDCPIYATPRSGKRRRTTISGKGQTSPQHTSTKADVLTDPLTSAPSLPPRSSSPRRDAHQDRVRVFKDTLAHQKERLFDETYKTDQYFLKILLCHPNYRRRGAGTALALWGVREAQLRCLPTTLFSSPMGLPLYEKLGFRTVESFKVQVEGEQERLEIPALVLEPRAHQLTGLLHMSPMSTTYQRTTSILCQA